MAVTVFHNKLDQQTIETLFSTRFVIAWNRLDQNNSQIIYRTTIEDSAPVTLRKVREKFVLHGYFYMLGSVSYPYYGGDEVEIERLFDEYFGRNFEVWICDRAFNWCIEFKNGGDVSFAVSPYCSVIESLRQRV